ncbi:BSP-domain-containing protein [Marasmius fiardii PR-910]|nr:BSP-domain-containing protein [Marasmius fiardii PR-910]
MPPPPSKPDEPVHWPIPKFNLRVEDLLHPGASVFFQNAEALSALKDAVLSSFKWLYHTPDMAPTNVKSILLVLRPMEGVAFTRGSASEKEIHFSLDYIKRTEARAREEILGVITHEVVHCYQYNANETCPGGLIEGFADYVRLRSSLAPPHWNQNAGDKYKWDAGYETTAYFLDWIARKYGEDKIRELNERMKDAKYDEEMFSQLIGKSVQTLWKAYSDELDPLPSPPRNPTTNWPEPQLNFRVEDLEHPASQIFLEHINPVIAMTEAMASTFKWLYAQPEKAPNK